MSREIKFRGLTASSGMWICGDLVHEALDGRHSRIDIGIKQDRCYPVEVTETTVGQFTGMYDVDGKAIYEGDILKHHQGIGQVWYRENIAAFTVDGFDGNYQLTRGEVIGNKHQNMDLLKTHMNSKVGNM
jgi:hypothetical protein